MKDINREKRLIQLKDVPKHFSADEIAYEIRKIMNYDVTTEKEMKDLAGIFLEEDGNNNTHVKFYIFFLSINSIKKFLNLCHVINEKKFVYMFNQAIQVQYKQEEIWTLMTAEHINEQLSDKEIRVKNTTFTNISTLIHLLPEHTRSSIKHHQIFSIIQNTNSIFIRFSSKENAIRARTMLEREGMQTEYSKTYVCLCKELIDEFPVPKKRLSEQPIQSADSNMHKRSKISYIDEKLKEKGNESLNSDTNIQNSLQIKNKNIKLLDLTNNQSRNEDVLMLTHDIQFSDDE
ncbi:hypothetical protein ACKWTF_016891 [Chironomus riparius]